MAYEIEYSDEALADLTGIEAFDRARIVDTIEEQLTYQPTVITKHRKPVVAATWLEGVGATWELQIGEWRALYDIEPETKVLVVRVIFKGTMTLQLALEKASGGKEEESE